MSKEIYHRNAADPWVTWGLASLYLYVAEALAERTPPSAVFEDGSTKMVRIALLNAMVVLGSGTVPVTYSAWRILGDAKHRPAEIQRSCLAVIISQRVLVISDLFTNDTIRYSYAYAGLGSDLPCGEDFSQDTVALERSGEDDQVVFDSASESGMKYCTEMRNTFPTVVVIIAIVPGVCGTLSEATCQGCQDN